MNIRTLFNMVKKRMAMDNSGQMNILQALVLGVSVAAITLIIFSVVAGQTYESSEAQITAITSNTVEGNVLDAAQSGFAGLTTVGDYIPVFVGLGVLIAVLGAVSLFSGASGGGRRRSTR